MDKFPVFPFSLFLFTCFSLCETFSIYSSYAYVSTAPFPHQVLSFVYSGVMKLHYFHPWFTVFVIKFSLLLKQEKSYFFFFFCRFSVVLAHADSWAYFFFFFLAYYCIIVNQLTLVIMDAK